MEENMKNMAPCMINCPAHVDIRGYINSIKNGDLAGALKLILQSLPMPSSIARICPHPCENFCTRRLKDASVNIHQLRISLTDMLAESGDFKDCFQPGTAKKNKKIAVIGAGPAGISGAYFLNRLGYRVSIFEAMPEAGGMLRYGIPQYRLPKEVLNRDIHFLNSDNFDLHFGFEINKEKFSRLMDNFHAIIIAVGLWKSNSIKIKIDKPEDSKYIIDGIKFLRDIAENKNISDVKDKKIVVIGGGNTAIDVCRTAIRLGAKSVVDVYRRTRNEMPAQLSELAEAIEEGVILKELMAPLKVTGFKNNKSVILQKYVLWKEGLDGRRTSKPIEEFEKEDFDILISAVGQRADIDFFDGEKTRDGLIKVNNYFQTDYGKVFAIGDVSSENKAKLAVNAVADAQFASRCVDNFLMGYEIGRGLEKSGSVLLNPLKSTKQNKDTSVRLNMKKVDATERKNNFDEILLSFEQADFLAEANRCLNCKGCVK